MLLRRVHFTLKPHLPWRLRLSLRRMHAHPLRRSKRRAWPIDPAAPKRPDGWRSWPARKNSSVVQHLKDRFPDAYWHALHRQVAAFVRDWRNGLAKSFP